MRLISSSEKDAPGDVQEASKVPPSSAPENSLPPPLAETSAGIRRIRRRTCANGPSLPEKELSLEYAGWLDISVRTRLLELEARDAERHRDTSILRQHMQQTNKRMEALQTERMNNFDALVQKKVRIASEAMFAQVSSRTSEIETKLSRLRQEMCRTISEQTCHIYNLIESKFEISETSPRFEQLEMQLEDLRAFVAKHLRFCPGLSELDSDMSPVWIRAPHSTPSHKPDGDEEGLPDLFVARATSSINEELVDKIREFCWQNVLDVRKNVLDLHTRLESLACRIDESLEVSRFSRRPSRPLRVCTPPPSKGKKPRRSYSAVPRLDRGLPAAAKTGGVTRPGGSVLLYRSRSAGPLPTRNFVSSASTPLLAPRNSNSQVHESNRGPQTVERAVIIVRNASPSNPSWNSNRPKPLHLTQQSQPGRTPAHPQVSAASPPPVSRQTCGGRTQKNSQLWTCARPLSSAQVAAMGTRRFGRQSP